MKLVSIHTLDCVFARKGEIGKIFFTSLFILYFHPAHSQLDDSLTNAFYQQLYSYEFLTAESTLDKIHQQQKNDGVYEMVSINYGYWMLFTGKNTPQQNDELLQQIESDIKIIETRKEVESLSQESLLRLILLYSFQSRIHNKLDNKISAIQAFRTSYSYFKELKSCYDIDCEVYNLVAGMYYVLTGYIRKDYPVIFNLAFEDDLADVNKGLSLLAHGIDSPTLQIQIESRYFLMKLHAEVNDDPEKALPHANQLVSLFPDNLTYRVYQLYLYDQLGKKQELVFAYNQFLQVMYRNKQLSKNQKKVLLEECHENITLTSN